MSSLGLENILILIGESFWIVGAYAQLRKLLRTGDAHGLSPATITLNAAGTIAWIVYFYSEKLWYPVATNIVFFILTVAILYLVLHNATRFRVGVLAILCIAPPTALALVYFPEIAGWLGAAYNLIAATPWLLHVLSTKKLQGISKRSLWYDQIAMGCTLAYALIIGSAPLIAGCMQGFIYTWIILYRAYKYAK